MGLSYWIITLSASLLVKYASLLPRFSGSLRLSQTKKHDNYVYSQDIAQQKVNGVNKRLILNEKLTPSLKLREKQLLIICLALNLSEASSPSCLSVVV